MRLGLPVPGPLAAHPLLAVCCSRGRTCRLLGRLRCRGIRAGWGGWCFCVGWFFRNRRGMGRWVHVLAGHLLIARFVWRGIFGTSGWSILGLCRVLLLVLWCGFVVFFRTRLRTGRYSWVCFLGMWVWGRHWCVPTPQVLGMKKPPLWAACIWCY